MTNPNPTQGGAQRSSTFYFDEAGRRHRSRMPVPVDQIGRLAQQGYRCRRCVEPYWYPKNLKAAPPCPTHNRLMTEWVPQRPPLLPYTAIRGSVSAPLRPVWGLLGVGAVGAAVDATNVPSLALVAGAPVAFEVTRRAWRRYRLAVHTKRGNLDREDPQHGKRLRAAVDVAARKVGYTAAAGCAWLTLPAGLGIDPATVGGKVVWSTLPLAWAPPAATYWRMLRQRRNKAPAVVVESEPVDDGTDPEEARVLHIWSTVLAVRAGGVTGYAGDGTPVKATQAGKLAGTRLEDWHRVEGGWAATIVGPIGAYESDQFSASMGKIASAFSVKKSMVTVIPDPDDENRSLVMIQRVSPIAETPRWAGPDSIDVRRGSAPVMRYADGEPCMYELWRPGWGCPHVAAFGTTGVAKALALDTPIPTPDGWTTMGDLHAGDQVFDERGQPCNVVAATPVMYDRPCYEVVFSDGTTIVADAKHQWRTTTQRGRWQVHNHGRRQVHRRDRRHLRAMLDTEPVTTEQIAATLWANRGGNQPPAANHAIDVCGPLEYPKRDLSVAPYTLGAWLGDGFTASPSIACADREITDNIRLDGYEVTKRSGKYAYGVTNAVEYRRRAEVGAALVTEGVAPHVAARHVGVGLPAIRALTKGHNPVGFRHVPPVEPTTPPLGRHETMPTLLRNLGVLGNKHIPEQYLRASAEQRRALLAGLLDTDGTCLKNGQVVFSVTNERLANDALELILGLGYKATMRTQRVRGRTEASSTAYKIAFTPNEPVFRVRRKADRQHPVRDTSTARRRYIVDVKPVPSVPVRCIQVDSPSRLYLASKACVPTHNSSFLKLLFVIDRWAHFEGRGLVADFLVDPQQGQSFAEFLDELAAPVACEFDEAMMLVEALHREALRRNRYLAREAKWWDERRKKWRTGREWWDPLVDGPILALTIDEAHDYLSYKPFATLVTKAGRMWRKCGLQLRLATHTPLLSDLGGSMALRDMLTGGFVWVGRTANSLSGPVAFNGRLPVDPRLIPALPGMAYPLAGLNPKPMLARTMREPDWYDWLRDENDERIGYPATLPPETLEAFGPWFAQWVKGSDGAELWTPPATEREAERRGARVEESVLTALHEWPQSAMDMNQLDDALRLAGVEVGTLAIRTALRNLRDEGSVASDGGQHSLTSQGRQAMAERAEVAA